MSEHAAHRSAGDLRDVVTRTAAALRVAVRRPDSRWIGLGAGGVYLLVYLATIGDLSIGGPSGGFRVQTVQDLARAFESLGFFRFEAVAAVSGAGVTFLVSPLNILVGGVLAALVGANVGLTYLGLVQPRACGLESSAGVAAGVPALLSGAACCGPTILLVVGVQASATIISWFQLFVPIAVVLLAGGLLLIGRQVDTTVL